jgi:hypothetical protein
MTRPVVRGPSEAADIECGSNAALTVLSKPEKKLVESASSALRDHARGLRRRSGFSRAYGALRSFTVTVPQSSHANTRIATRVESQHGQITASGIGNRNGKTCTPHSTRWIGRHGPKDCGLAQPSLLKRGRLVYWNKRGGAISWRKP